MATQGAPVFRACREGGVALAMLVPEAEQDWPPRSPPAGASHDMLLDHASSGRGGTAAALHGRSSDGRSRNAWIRTPGMRGIAPRHVTFGQA
jgi:hypothetical protein